MLTVLLLFQQHLAASFVIGFALALSSTAFVLQLLTEKQQLNTTYAQQSFSILLFQDIAAIPLLAVIPLLAGTESTHHGIAYFAAIIATFTGLFLFSRYV
ncbi:cation:proton antiporter domain-containing protein, partial [Stenotrophomonas maltophilia]|uniref:cation:proton antiporter domain-containing protein n=1 Tax=Stenotrophomonas maltophilia TaxID=40324 RepID=UPI001EF9AA08